jgi:hypothetical protein
MNEALETGETTDVAHITLVTDQSNHLSPLRDGVGDWIKNLP